MNKPLMHVASLKRAHVSHNLLYNLLVAELRTQGEMTEAEAEHAKKWLWLKVQEADETCGSVFLVAEWEAKEAKTEAEPPRQLGPRRGTDEAWDEVALLAKQLLSIRDSARYAPPEGQGLWIREASDRLNQIASHLGLVGVK